MNLDVCSGCGRFISETSGLVGYIDDELKSYACADCMMIYVQDFKDKLVYHQKKMDFHFKEARKELENWVTKCRNKRLGL